MSDIRNTPSYKTLPYSNYFDNSPRILLPQSDFWRNSKRHSDATHNCEKEESPGVQSQAVCEKLLCGLAVVIVVYLLIKYLPNMFQGSGGCSRGPISARTSTGASANVAHVVKSGNELNKIVAGLADGQSAVVMFHAPWCGHCKSTMPAYKGAAEKNTCNTLYLLADCHNDFTPEAVKENGVQGFPTFKRFAKNKTAVEHTGGRSESAISKFACSA